MLNQQQLLLLLLLIFITQILAGKVVDVGVILDARTVHGKMGRTSISIAFDDFYEKHDNYSSRLTLHFQDSNDTTIGAASNALDLLTNIGVKAIIGPSSSAQAVFVSDLGRKTQVPIISFTTTSSSLASSHGSYFVRTTLNDSSQVGAISSLVKTCGWREVVLVYEDTEFGSGFAPYLVDSLQDAGVHTSHRCVISLFATEQEIEEELQGLMRMQTRVFVVHMVPTLGSRLFLKAEEVGMMGEGYVWIVSTGLTTTLGLMDAYAVGKMQGVLGVKPYIPTTSKRLEEFSMRWKERFKQENPLAPVTEPSEYDLWAYDTVWALAMAVEVSNLTSSSLQQGSKSGINRNLTTLLRVSPAGPELLRSILSTDFDGLSGRFRLEGGQLEPMAFELVNLVGKGTRTIGYWTQEHGISRYRNSKASVRVPEWPGNSLTTPKGWEWPTRGKKLRIGVPLADGFLEYFAKMRDHHKKTVSACGFCIEIFEAAMANLSYHVPYEYVYVNSSHGTYDDLAYKVYLKNFDAVVADTTISWNRSKYVDFTTPFTESGVVMVVPIVKKSHEEWGFLDPMTNELWLASLGFFIFTGVVIWLLELGNGTFGNTPLEKLGTALYFSFATLVFAHKDILTKILSRVVVIVWIFVVLVWQSSYTASLSSIVTSQQLQVGVTDVKDLIGTGDYVGCVGNSFMRSFLVNLGFNESKIRTYNSTGDFDEALTIGSSDGGVAAIFDEIPYMNFFISKYPSKYTVVGQTYKTDGFGFIFPKGSPLVPDVSRAILQLKEGDEMSDMEKRFYGDLAYGLLTPFTDQRNTNTTNRLSFGRFLALFVITGITSTSMLFLYIAVFLYQNRRTYLDHSGSRWQKTIAMARAFHERRPTVNPVAATPLD